MKMLKSTLVLLAVLGLASCGKTEQEVRHDEVVKAQALGCIDSNAGVAYEKDANMETKNLIDVCFEKEKQRKAEVYKKEEAERQARLLQIQKEQQQLALEQQKLQMQQQYSRPVAPGEYQSRIGDTNCGFWDGLGQWQWYPNMSQCKEETDNYLAYAVFAGLIGAEVIDEMFDQQKYKKYNQYKPVKVKDYYSQNGKVVSQRDYQKDYSVYNTRKNYNVSGYKKEVTRPKQYDSSLYSSGSSTNKNASYNTTSNSTKKEVVKPKQYDSSLYGSGSSTNKNASYNTTSTSTKKEVVKPKQYNSNLFGNSQSAKKQSSSSSSTKKSSSSSSSSKKSGGGRKPR